MLTKFELAALVDIDGGRINTAFMQALNRCRLDCEDRPGTKKARKVTMTVDLIPVIDERGDLGDVVVSFQIKDSLPIRESRPYTMRAQKGTLVFNDLSREDPNQLTLDELGPKGEVANAQ